MEQLTRLNFKTEICRDINDAIYRAIQNRTTKEINDILNVLKKDIEDYISENNDGTYRYTIFTKIGETKILLIRNNKIFDLNQISKNYQELS